MSGCQPLSSGSRFLGSTTIVRQVLHQQGGATVVRCVARCRPAEYRVWVKATADRYPVKIHLLMYSTIKVRNGIQATPLIPPSMSACPVTSLSILSRAG